MDGAASKDSLFMSKIGCLTRVFEVVMVPEGVDQLNFVSRQDIAWSGLSESFNRARIA